MYNCSSSKIKFLISCNCVFPSSHNSESTDCTLPSSMLPMFHVPVSMIVAAAYSCTGGGGGDTGGNMCTAVHCTLGPPKIFFFCRWQMCPFKEKLLIYLSPYRNFLRRFLCLFYSRSDTVIYHAANKRICQVTDSLHLSNIDKLFSKKWLREVAKKRVLNIGGWGVKVLHICRCL